MKEKQQGILIGIILTTMIFCAMGATVYKSLVGTGSPVNNSVVVWDGVGGNRVRYSGIIINATNDISGVNILRVGQFAPDSPLLKIYGGTGGTNNETIQASLGLVPGLDIQAYSISLLQIATIGVSSGDFLYFDGSNITNFGSTSYGRALLNAASVAAQRTALGVGALSDSEYDSDAWDLNTTDTPTMRVMNSVFKQLNGSNVIITSVDADSFIIDSGELQLTAAAGGARWVGSYGVGDFTNYATSTNYILSTFSITSNDAPTVASRHLEGSIDYGITNNSGGIVNFYFVTKVNGSVLTRAQRSVSTSSSAIDLYSSRFKLIRASDSLAIVSFNGDRLGHQSGMIGGLGGIGSGGDISIVATNFAYDWLTNNEFQLEVWVENLSGTNLSGNEIGVQRYNASLYRP